MKERKHYLNPEKDSESLIKDDCFLFGFIKELNNSELVQKRNVLKSKKSVGRVKRWRQKNPEKQRELYKKHAAKRNREFEFETINCYFDNSNAHHLDKTYVVYIPCEIHKSVRHRQKNEEQMKRINLISWDFLEASVL